MSTMMDRWLKSKRSAPNPIDSDDSSSSKSKQSRPLQVGSEFNLAELPADPGLRPPLISYRVEHRDQIRRAYLQKGPSRPPPNHEFPLTKCGNQNRRFNPSWFNQYPYWLEYSVFKDAAFCLPCYLFKQSISISGGDSFSSVGFNTWKQPDKLGKHIGKGPNSPHNIAVGKCHDLVNQNQHIENVLCKKSDKDRSDYRTRLHASVESARLLLEQGLAFRGHDESEDSINPGNFRKILRMLARNCPDIGAVVLKNAPQNNQLIAPNIQKEIVSVAAMETIKVITSDLGDAHFSILIDEARDISIKEQMAVVIRYVDQRGHVIERFLGVEHVTDTSARTLKNALDSFFCRYGLSISRLRGQGYDGASNMQGEYNGLKSLILKENSCAYYVHCFAHQLQLALVGVAKEHDDIASLFKFISRLLNVVGGSCKRRDKLREIQAAKIAEALDIGELSSEQGLNQETSLKRAGDTRWSSHYHTLVSLSVMFDAVTDVLEIIGSDSLNSDHRDEAKFLLDTMQSFEFVFRLILMKNILAITNELSQTLQRKDQDIVNAMNLVQISKQLLQEMRESGWTSLLDEVSSFCEKHDINVVDMDDMYVVRGRKKRNAHEMKNLHHYQVELFYMVLDMQLQELNTRFTVSNTDLLLCMACLNPSNLFSQFDKNKLMRFAEFYPNDVSTFQCGLLYHQLDTYIADMRSSIEFSSVGGISELARLLVQTGRHKVYPLVYLLITLALTLPVATATVERAFSAMNIIKNRLRNRISDEWLSDSLVVYIEKDVFEDIENDKIMETFQNMKTRRGQL